MPPAHSFLCLPDPVSPRPASRYIKVVIGKNYFETGEGI